MVQVFDFQSIQYQYNILVINKDKRRQKDFYFFSQKFNSQIMWYHFICIYWFSPYRLEAYSNGVVTHFLETGFLEKKN